MVQLPRNEKQTHRLNSRLQMWPLGLTLAMTLTLNFQGQISNWLYLSQKWSMLVKGSQISSDLIVIQPDLISISSDDKPADFFCWSHCHNSDDRNIKLHLSFHITWKIVLTHWGWDKMDTISQTTFSSAFSWMKIYQFWLQLSPLPEPIIVNLPTHICVTRPQWVNEIGHSSTLNCPGNKL